MNEQKHKVKWFGKLRKNALVWAFTLVELIVVINIYDRELSIDEINVIYNLYIR